MSNSVVINGKTHDLNRLSLIKLEHVAQLAQIQIDNYCHSIRNYPQERMVKFGQPFLNHLISVKNQVEEAMAKHNLKDQTRNK